MMSQDNMGESNDTSHCYGNLDYKGVELICTTAYLFVGTHVMVAHQEDLSVSEPSEPLSNSVSPSNSQ